MCANGYNEEENKMIKETHKIWGTQDVGVTATCVRVPVMRTHAESINLEFKQGISEAEVRCRQSCATCTHAPLMRTHGRASAMQHQPQADHC